ICRCASVQAAHSVKCTAKRAVLEASSSSSMQASIKLCDSVQSNLSSDRIFAQIIAEQLASARQARHHGTDRYAGNLCNFLVRQFIQLLQDDDFPEHR